MHVHKLSTLPHISGYSTSALHYMKASRALNTVRAYKADWKDFSYFCQQYNYLSMPASHEAVIEYLASLGNSLSVGTIARRLAAIAAAHAAAGYISPTMHPHVKELMAGIRRTLGTKIISKSPIIFDDLDTIIEVFDDSISGLRNRALILLGFSGGFRRSELISLNMEDIQFHPQGLEIHIAHSKTDKNSEGQTIGIPLLSNYPHKCPVRALKSWLQASAIRKGPIFRPVTKAGTIRNQRLSDRSVANIVKIFATKIGKDPDKFAGHSLRRGFVTSAALAGAPERHIMKTTRHKTERMVRRYIEDTELFKDNALDILNQK